MHAVLDPILAPGPIEVFEDVERWWPAHVDATAHLDAPIDRAIVGASRVDRLGFAFAGGYRAALDALVPALPRDHLASLAATEAGGAHPRAIQTTLARDDAGLFVDGHKQWVTLGRAGGVLLVVARLPDVTGPHPSLRVVRVDAQAPGVHVEPLPAAPFVPEIPHAKLVLDHVRVATEDVLPGDGYADYLKPFRTIEDLHVHAAVLAWLAAVLVRVDGPRALVEALVASVVTARALAREDPRAPAVHVATAGLVDAATRLVADAEPIITGLGGALAERWVRDRALLAVASKARAQRRERAWEVIRGARAGAGRAPDG
ncbi:acyl-CoA dehydrogenase family protein [Myxococcota bacterium]|nr:acyl-CoA dehydrogenase family protein [Myxococcota bacterium]